MTEQERKDVATVLSSILTRSMNRMTIMDLNRDFVKIEGYGIPFMRFGCTNIEQFLRTLNDKVQVHGFGPNAEVQVIISQKTAHINELIARQRPPKQQTRRFQRSFPQGRRSFHCNTNNFTYYNPPIQNKTPTFQNTAPAFQNTEPAFENTPKYNNNNNQSITPPFNPVIRTSTPNSGAIPKRTTLNSTTDADDIFFSDEENTQNLKVPQCVQDNLQKLILKFPDGILCSNMLELYRKEYGKTLSYSEYGYRSIAQMCVELKNIFSFLQLDKSDIKLFDKGKPIPENSLNIIKKLQLMKIKASSEVATENAIPEDDIEEMMTQACLEKTPPDVVQFGTELEQQWIDTGANEQDYIDVNVGEIYDPSKFWITLKMYMHKLDTLMDDMQVFYAVHKQELQVPYLAFKPGMYIACVFLEEYHRARIVDTSQKREHIIKVYYVDYGTVSVISVEGACYLHNKFAELPTQAIRARLAGIFPPAENEQWTRSAASRFLSFVKQKDLVAQLIEIDETEKILDVILADTSEEGEDFFINDALVSMGYAIFTFEKRHPAKLSNVVPIVRFIHLFPTHAELENGLVPTACQMIYMVQQAGMCIEQIYPHYFKDAKTGLPILQTSENHTFDENTSDENATSFEAATKTDWEDLVEEEELHSNEVVPTEEILDTSPIESSQTEDDFNSKLNSPEEKTSSSFSESHENDDKTPLKKSFIVKIKTEGSTSTQTINYSTPTSPEHHGVRRSEQQFMAKAVRPPPGYDNVVPNNTCYNYNYNPYPNANNYIANQTYINFPMPYSYPMQQPIYGYLPPPNDYFYWNLVKRIQELVNRGAILSPEQLRFLQTFNTGQQPPVHYENPYAVPGGYQGMQYGYEQNYHPEMMHETYPGHFEKRNAYPEGYHQRHLPANPITNTTRAVDQRQCDNVDSQVFPVNKSADKNIQSDSKIDGAVQVKCEKEVATQCENNFDNVVEEIVQNTSITNTKTGTEEELLNTEHAEDKPAGPYGEFIENRKAEQFSENIPRVEETPCDQDNSKETLMEEAIDLTLEDVSSTTMDNSILMNNEISELESVYEDCDSNSVYNDGTRLTILNKDETKFVTLIGIGTLDMHFVYHQKEFYFLLTELSKKIFGKSLSVVQIRKLFIGTPYIISVVDIRLKTHPELKKELTKYGLISENDLTVDAIPIKYLKDLTEIISTSENQVENVNYLLKEVDYILSS